MLPQFGASKLSTDCDNSQRFNSYLRVHHVHCKRTCPFAPPSHASLSHTRPLKMTCLVDTQSLSQNRSSAIAAHTDDFIHTATSWSRPAQTKPARSPVSHRCNRSPPLPPKQLHVQSNRRPTLIRIVSVPTSRFELSGNKSRSSGWAYKLSTGQWLRTSGALLLTSVTLHEVCASVRRPPQHVGDQVCESTAVDILADVTLPKLVPRQKLPTELTLPLILNGSSLWKTISPTVRLCGSSSHRTVPKVHHVTLSEQSWSAVSAR